MNKRLEEVCNNFGVDKQRVEKSFDFLKKERKNDSEICIVDYLESQIKMLHYGAIKHLPGER